jgi:hypothetical protein
VSSFLFFLPPYNFSTLSANLAGFFSFLPLETNIKSDVKPPSLFLGIQDSGFKWSFFLGLKSISRGAFTVTVPIMASVAFATKTRTGSTLSLA